MTLELVEKLGISSDHSAWAGYPLHGRKWTLSSDFEVWRDGVLYCVKRNTALHTLGDAVEFRHDTNGADNSSEAQHTRTLIGMVYDGKAGTRAFIWEPSAQEVEMLADHPQITGSYLRLAAQDPLVSRVKAFAESTGRTFILPRRDIELSVQPDQDGSSEYGRNKIVEHLMGVGNAQKNAEVICQNGIDRGCVRFDCMYVPQGEMRVRHVGLGASGYDDINGVIANGDFDGIGRSRGVAVMQ